MSAPEKRRNGGSVRAQRQVFNRILKIAATDLRVPVTGASGTGKKWSRGALISGVCGPEGPFVAINCAAIPRELLESELFGHEKGAFTGAYRTSIGTVERAQGGTSLWMESGNCPWNCR